MTIANYRDAIARLDDDERVSVLVDTLGGPQVMAAITESGLFALILTSNKPEAKRFRKFVTAEVLPTIRRTGQYGGAALGSDMIAVPKDEYVALLEALICGAYDYAELTAKWKRIQRVEFALLRIT